MTVDEIRNAMSDALAQGIETLCRYVRANGNCSADSKRLAGHVLKAIGREPLDRELVGPTRVSIDATDLCRETRPYWKEQEVRGE